MASRFSVCSALSCGALLLAACGDESPADNLGGGESELALAMSALQNPILSCQIQAGECVFKATDLASLQACHAGIGDCLKAAGKQVHKIADGVLACSADRGKCLRGSGSGCFGEFEKCVQDLVPTGPSGWPGGSAHSEAGVPLAGDAGLIGVPVAQDGGISGPPDAGAGPTLISGLGDGGLNVPPLPGLGDGGMVRLPPSSPQLPGAQCLDGLSECARKPGTSLLDCAIETRRCLESAVPFPPFQLP